MKNESHQIDEFYREVLKDNTQKASAFIWARMRWRLFWMSNYRYVLGFGAAAVIIIAAYFMLSPENGNLQNTSSEQHLTTTITENEPAQNEPAISGSNESHTREPATGQATKENPTDKSEDITTVNDEINSKGNAGLTTTQTATLNNSVTSSSFEITNKPPENEMNDLPETLPVAREELSIHFLTSKNIDPGAPQTTGLVEKIPYDVKLKKNWVSIGFYVSPAYTAFTLKADDGYQDHLQYRKDHESPAVSVSGGLSIRVNIGNGFIQTGLEYSEYKQYRNYNNSFKAFDSLNSYYRTDTIWGWVFDPPDVGKPIILGYDTVFVPVYNTTNEGYNRWQYLEIPLIGGYRFNKGRVGFEAATGFSCSFLLDASGNVPHLTDKNRFTELGDMKDEMNKYLFNYILQLGFTYHITPAWSFNLSPFYKQNLNSVFKNNYPIEQKFRSFGINFGLKVDL